ncbi:hypothetical protein AURDEDRAFT_112850 [Auricularia subglabra TFB-10046 SS5]|nr:hypothetical protein AURDEDRAFT_112850 [Auricularia subglabra TFB-10046 SS5]
MVRAIERLSNLYEITYTEFCRRYGTPFLLLFLSACSPFIERITLRAPMFCKKLDAALSQRSFPAVHTLELHDNAELDSPADIFPSVEDLTIRSEHGAFTEFPVNLCQAFAQTLTTLRLDGVGCANATPMLSLPGLRSLHIDQAVPAVIPLFARTPVVEIEVLNAAHPHVGVFLNALRGSALPFARLARIAMYPQPGRRAKRLLEAPGLRELQEMCDTRGISLEIVVGW